MRKALTPPEFLLWERLKTRDESRLMFRRQHPLGPYILDFYCAPAKLAIEVDGALHGHGDAPERDAIRDNWLMAKGLMVYRIPAAEVFKDPDSVADGIRLLALERVRERKQETPPPRPETVAVPLPKNQRFSGR
jgi:very-short-patch-repair endonuclease